VTFGRWLRAMPAQGSSRLAIDLGMAMILMRRPPILSVAA
jgi:hypothetical protein